jgi:undecaprenyl-diphosphatase
LKPIHAFIIGVAQGIAIIPALSRSGLTVGSAMLMGIEPKVSAEFSFLLGIPAMLGAVLLELFEVQKGAPPLPSLLGFLSSMGMGVLAIAIFIRTLKKGSFLFFALYCVLLGIVSFVLFPPW